MPDIRAGHLEVIIDVAGTAGFRFAFLIAGTGGDRRILVGLLGSEWIRRRGSLDLRWLGRRGGSSRV